MTGNRKTRYRPRILENASQLSVADDVPGTTDAAPCRDADGLAGGGIAERDRYLSTLPGPGRFPLAGRGRAAALVVSAGDHAGVLRAAGDLQADIARVTGIRPEISIDGLPTGRDLVLIGTIGRAPLIDRLVAAGRLDVSGIAGRWETSLEQVVIDPLPGVPRAFVIAGSDQRGTIYGVYDVSKGIGVSPWYWWDDVPPVHQDALYVLPGRHSQGMPAVAYRGFFINDENPCTGDWAPAYFGPGHAPGYPGGLNHHYYEKVFELALRLKANYVWPAVWGRAFAEDDSANQATATRYGIVIGTSHEAPMAGGIEEWNRHAVPPVREPSGAVVQPGHDPYGGTGEWSYRRNRAAIEAHWARCFRRMVEQGAEMTVTLGMRGNGDTALPDGDGIELMRGILARQREIITQVLRDAGTRAAASGISASGIPQVWTLYKEVQRYWDEGLRVPDDVTVIFTDDNWGNIRKLPDPADPSPRSGGYGLYYHVDYVGGGRSYKWVDTTNLANTWEQLHTAYSYGIRRLWVVNAGDLKHSELPVQLFLDYAWHPDAVPLAELPEWARRYAAQNFGRELAPEIARVLQRYAFLQSRRKPELLNRRISVDPSRDLATDPRAVVYDDQASPYSLTNYRELEIVTEQWQELAARVERVAAAVPESHRDAFVELVGYQVRASANLYALRAAEFTNLHYAAQGRAATNELAAAAEARFADDQALAEHYNTALAGGKWAGWQAQAHIGYGDVARYGPMAVWQQPERDGVPLPDEIFPPVRRIELPEQAILGVAVDGSECAWPCQVRPDVAEPCQPRPRPAQPCQPHSGAAESCLVRPGTARPGAVPPCEAGEPVLPEFSPYQSQPTQYIEVFNRGSAAFEYRIEPTVPWLLVSPAHGTLDPHGSPRAEHGGPREHSSPPDEHGGPRERGGPRGEYSSAPAEHSGTPGTQVRALVRVDWSRAPSGTSEVPIEVSGAGARVTVRAVLHNPAVPAGQLAGFIEANGYVSILAEHFTTAVSGHSVGWIRIPQIAKTGAGMAPFPVTAPRQLPGGGGPRLEYAMTLFSAGSMRVDAWVAPRCAAIHPSGLCYAISIDDDEPQVVNLARASGADGGAANRQWARVTSDNVTITGTIVTVDKPGVHTLKFWMVDPTVVLEKLVVDTGGVRPSYLGPPESRRADR